MCITAVIFSNSAIATRQANLEVINKLEFTFTLVANGTKLLQLTSWGPDFDPKCVFGLD
jgi:hypothetical protein